MAVPGLTVMWSSGPASPAASQSPVLPALVPVTVWAPAVDAVQVAAVHEPSGEIVNVVVEVTSLRMLPYWSAVRAM